jgi:hypothetical protein
MPTVTDSNTLYTRDFLVGDWWARQTLNRLERDEARVQLEPKSMEVLVDLTEHAGVIRSKRRPSPLRSRSVRFHARATCLSPTLHGQRRTEPPTSVGIFDQGVARVRCPHCRHEFLIAFSCKLRGLCPSCHQKRELLWAQWAEQELLEDIPHRQVVFTITKRLRI